MEKTKLQSDTEQTHHYMNPRPQKRRITKEVPNSPCKVGEIVTVKLWGTFGCWDEQNRWVDFWNSESVN